MADKLSPAAARAHPRYERAYAAIQRAYDARAREALAGRDTARANRLIERRYAELRAVFVDLTGLPPGS